MTEHFAGLDVSIETTAVCVVDGAGEVVLRCEAPTEAAAIAAVLAPFAATLRRAGHEAGALSPWLQPELRRVGLPAVCLETCHVRAALAAQRNKTDATDALGLAHIMRTGWFRTAHVKTEGAYRLRLLLTQRRQLKRKFMDIENTIRHSLKAFGVKLGGVSRGRFERAVREACADDPFTAELMEAVLAARAALWTQYTRLHALVLRVVAGNPICRRFMGVPGVGPVCALAYAAGVDDPDRFKRSRDVAAYFGLTSKRRQRGTSINVKGRVSKAGDPAVREALFEAAACMLLRYRGTTAMRAWGLKLAKAKGFKKAIVAVARKLAVVLHAMWRTGTDYTEAPCDAGARRKARKLMVACG
ncbi:IS110 family transposase [Phenylobacterium sp.]|jgi:transposase|uniref:IS110 family transposase n=1 Tax=Phenylobacterium sp. TaxID=1871053 RepID=UPI0039C8E892